METLFAALLVIFLFFAPGLAVADGNSLLSKCKAAMLFGEKSPQAGGWEDLGEAKYCAGFLDGVAGIGSVAQQAGRPIGFCPPSNAPTGQFIRVFTRFLQDHPEKLHYNGASLAVEAFHDAFPCASPGMNQKK